MSYNNPGEVLTDIADSIRTLNASTSSIPFIDMPGLIKGAISEPIDLSGYDGTSWVLPFFDHIDFNTASTLRYMFSYIDCDAETSIHSLDLRNVPKSITSLVGLFQYSKFTEILGIEDWDTSNVTNMSQAFCGTHISNSLDLSNWDVSNVSSIDHLFYGLHILDFDLNGWDLSSGYSFISMFSYSNIQNLNLSNWTFTTHIMSGMFANAVISSLDLTGWDTSQVTAMYEMFAGAKITKMWVPSTFVATNCPEQTQSLPPLNYKPFATAPAARVHVFTDATDAETQGWGTISSLFTIHYNSTYQDFINA